MSTRFEGIIKVDIWDILMVAGLNTWWVLVKCMLIVLLKIMSTHLEGNIKVDMFKILTGAGL
jgi:hypothetical protein